VRGGPRARQVRRALERLLARQVVAALAGMRAGGLRGAVEPELGALLGTLRLSAAVPALSVRARPLGMCAHAARPRPAGAAAGPRGAAPAHDARGSTLRASLYGPPSQGNLRRRCPLPATLRLRQACWRARV